MSSPGVQQSLVRAHRDEWSRVVGALTRRFGDLDVAEDAGAEAFAKAVVDWPIHGVPTNPGAWLTTTATRTAIDWLRRENKRPAKYREAAHLYGEDPEGSSLGRIDADEDDPSGPAVDPIRDDRLRLILTCCHPALPREARVALTLRMVGGLSVEEIAGAFLVSVSAMARRITRAKTRIREQRITYEIPTLEDLPRRIPGVLDVLYLIFNEGYLASGAADAEGAEHHGLLRPDLMAEAVRLARLVHHLVREDGEATGLLALMLLIEARSPARTSADGSLVPLDRQDRSLWDPSMIAEGHRLIRERLGSGEVPGRFQFIAAINAVHTSAASFEQTDWPQVLALYDQLSACDPSPVVALNRAIAVAEVEGPQVALDLTDQFAERLAAYHAHHATRADLLRRLGRDEEAREAYTRAIDCAGNPAEIAELTRRRAEVQR